MTNKLLTYLHASMQGKWACFLSQFMWKEKRKWEDGLYIFLNFLLSPKGPIDLHNVPLDLDLMFYLYSNIQTHKGIYYISETEGINI